MMTFQIGKKGEEFSGAGQRRICFIVPLCGKRKAWIQAPCSRTLPFGVPAVPVLLPVPVPESPESGQRSGGPSGTPASLSAAPCIPHSRYEKQHGKDKFINSSKKFKNYPNRN